jgi:hypothetical protein
MSLIIQRAAAANPAFCVCHVDEWLFIAVIFHARIPMYAAWPICYS